MLVGPAWQSFESGKVVCCLQGVFKIGLVEWHKVLFWLQGAIIAGLVSTVLAQKVLTKISTSCSNFSVKTLSLHQSMSCQLSKVLNVPFTKELHQAWRSHQHPIWHSVKRLWEWVGCWQLMCLLFGLFGKLSEASTPHTHHSCLSIVKKRKPGNSQTFACAVKITPGYSECKTILQHQRFW